MQIKDVVNVIEHIAPLEYGESWDNTGIQINTGKNDINKILVAMEINDAVIQEAVDLKVDMIVTHHPLMFSKPKSIDKETVQGRYLINLIKNDISVYSAHLTFDNVPGGNNYYLGKLLGLNDIVEPGNNPTDEPGIVGELEEEISLKELGHLISEKWEIPKGILKVAGDLELRVKKIAICSGAGAGLLKTAILEDCQVLITGDTKLHEAQKAIAEGISLIDAGHYDTEKQFTENMASQLENKIENIEIIRSEARVNPFYYL